MSKILLKVFHKQVKSQMCEIDDATYLYYVLMKLSVSTPEKYQVIKESIEYIHEQMPNI